MNETIVREFRAATVRERAHVSKASLPIARSLVVVSRTSRAESRPDVYAGTQARSRIVFVGFSVLKTAFMGMPIFGSPSFM